MNILFIADDFPPYNFGGAGISTSLLVKGLAKFHNCYVVTKESKLKKWYFHKVPVMAVLQKSESENKNIKEVMIFSLTTIRKVVQDFFTIRKFVKKYQIELVNFVATSYFSALQIAILSLLGKPIIVDVRDLSLFHTITFLNKYRSTPRKRTPTLKILFKVFMFFENVFFQVETGILKFLSKSSDSKIRYVALSNYIKREMVKFGYPKDRITVINNISEVNTANNQYKDKRYQITFAGRIESEKGIWTVISAWELIDDPLLQLLIIGEGSVLSQLKEYVSKKKINNVTFLGRLPNNQVLCHYLESKIILAPSVWPEPFGRFILESIATRTPLISTKVGGISEAVKNKQTGILIKPNNPKQLAHSIKELLNNKQLYNNIVNNLMLEDVKYKPKKIISERQSVYNLFN